MATIKIILDKRASHTTVEGKHQLVLRIGHKSKTRDIGFDIHLTPDQLSFDPFKIKGIVNAERYTKRTSKTFGEIDLWLDENKAMIKLWSIAQLKDAIERKFFKKQSELSILGHSAKVLYRFYQEGQYSTASSYEDALKIFVKYQMKRAKKDDFTTIKTLYDKDAKKGFELKSDYEDYDMPIKAFSVEYAKDFKAYLSNRFNSINTVFIHLRSIQSILNDAEKTYTELKGHKPLETIKKVSKPNAPVVLTHEEIDLIRNLKTEEGTTRFDVLNIFLFMFNNMGMNFYDVALLKVHQFDGERINYSRKKTEKEGDHFSIKQSPENLEIIYYYMADKEARDYLFPIIPEGTPEPRIFRVKKQKTKLFNDHMKRITKDLGIKKNVTTYTARDTWTNLGLQMGIDIRKISSGLGHSNVSVTEKHYSQQIQEKILDEINSKIIQGPKP